MAKTRPSSTHPSTTSFLQFCNVTLVPLLLLVNVNMLYVVFKQMTFKTFWPFMPDNRVAMILYLLPSRRADTLSYCVALIKRRKPVITQQNYVLVHNYIHTTAMITVILVLDLFQGKITLYLFILAYLLFQNMCCWLQLFC